MTVFILIPQQLRSYTQGVSRISSEGRTIDEALTNLDSRYPGIRFRIVDEQCRIRLHMRVFVDGDRAMDLQTKIKSGSEIQIFGALSGG